MTGLLSVLDDHANPRVQAHAGAALVNFSENCSKSLILPYLDPIMNKLEEILNMKFEEVAREQILSTYSCGRNFMANIMENLFCFAS